MVKDDEICNEKVLKKVCKELKSCCVGLKSQRIGSCRYEGLIVMDLTEDLKKKVSTRPHLSAVVHIDNN